MSTPEGPASRNGPSVRGDTVAHRSVWQSGYWLVLALLLLSYVFCASQSSPSTSLLALLFQLLTVAVTLWVARVAKPVLRVGWTALAVVALAAVAVQIASFDGRILAVVLSVASMVAYLIAPMVIVAHQAKKVVVDGQTLLASIAAYVMVGMFFTFVYNLVALVTVAPLFGEGTVDSLTSQLFFSFTTLTTTGYGNLVPVGAFVQSVAIIEAIAGQLFLVIAVARVVSGWRPPH